MRKYRVNPELTLKATGKEMEAGAWGGWPADVALSVSSGSVAGHLWHAIEWLNENGYRQSTHRFTAPRTR
jgi:hypothetical protein